MAGESRGKSAQQCPPRVIAMKRKIAVFTGTRAEYGLLYWLMRGIQEDDDLILQVIVSGMHLSPEFGNTWEVVQRDGFVIDAKVEMLLSSDTPVGLAKSIGLGVIGMADALDRLSPDILVLLGDRFEALAAAQAAMALRIPIAHLHGGEITEGVIDEAVRHSITKMAHLHFTSTEQYRHRVIQLGEQPRNVFNVGAPGVENIRRLRLMTKNELEHSLDFRLGELCFLVTYHPVTLSEDGAVAALTNLLGALNDFPAAHVVITYPNADTGGRLILKQLQQYAQMHSDRVLLVSSLGQLRYLSMMSVCDIVIGNSSSGLIEAPSFHVPTINIGSRQKGRILPATVLQCGEKRSDIRKSIKKALTPEFKKYCKAAKNPYGDGFVAKKIINRIKKQKIGSLAHKRFFDISCVDHE